MRTMTRVSILMFAWTALATTTMRAEKKGAEPVRKVAHDLLAGGELSDWIEEQHAFYKAKHPCHPL